MASYTLSSLIARYRASPEEFRKASAHAWLVWTPRSSSQVVMSTGEFKLSTLMAQKTGDPVAIEVVKGKLPNAFAFGVTIGHAENNDIVLRQTSVSRFHAYIQVSGQTWSLSDADSRNGTFLEGSAIAPDKPTPLPEQANLRLGDLEARFFTAKGFIDFLEREAAARGQS